MLLASQVAGAVAAGLLVWILARSCGLRGQRAAAVVAAVSIAIGAVLSAPNLRDAVAKFIQERESNESLTPEQARLRPAIAIRPDNGFLAWAAQHIGNDESFQLIVGHLGRNPLLSQWALFQLEPRIPVAAPAAGDWVVFYDVVPRRYASRAYREVDVYKPGYAIARYAVAG